MKLARKRPLGSPWPRREDNICTGIKEIGVNARISIEFTQGKDYWSALANTALKFRFHKP